MTILAPAADAATAATAAVLPPITQSQVLAARRIWMTVPDSRMAATRTAMAKMEAGEDLNRIEQGDFDYAVAKGLMRDYAHPANEVAVRIAFALFDVDANDIVTHYTLQDVTARISAPGTYPLGIGRPSLDQQPGIPDTSVAVDERLFDQAYDKLVEFAKFQAALLAPLYFAAKKITNGSPVTDADEIRALKAAAHYELVRDHRGVFEIDAAERAVLTRAIDVTYDLLKGTDVVEVFTRDKTVARLHTAKWRLIPA